MEFDERDTARAPSEEPPEQKEYGEPPGAEGKPSEPPVYAAYNYGGYPPYPPPAGHPAAYRPEDPCQPGSVPPSGYAAYPLYYPPQYLYVRRPRDPNSKGRCFGRGIIAPAVFFVFGNIFALVYGAIYAYYFLSNRDIGNMLSFNSALQALNDAIANQAVFLTGVSGVICLAAFFFIHRRQRRGFANDTTLPRGGPGIMAVVCVAAVAFNIALTALIALIPEGVFEGSSLGENEALWMNFIVIGVVAPFVEEYCFRLLAFNHFRRGMRFWPANFLQAGLFGLVHMNVLQSVYAFALGLFMGWIYERTRSLWAPILTHVFFNCASLSLPLLVGNADIDVMLLLMPAAAVSIAGVVSLKILTKTRPVPRPAEYHVSDSAREGGVDNP